MTRAQEYTADRVASYYAPNHARDMAILMVGKHLWDRVDHDDLMEQIRKHKSILWIRIVNFLSDHAVGFRRYEALYRVQDEGWDVHGRML